MPNPSEHEPGAVVQPAVRGSHESLSEAALSRDRAEAVTWVAGMLRKGLSQGYALQLAEYVEPKCRLRLVERLRHANVY